MACEIRGVHQFLQKPSLINCRDDFLDNSRKGGNGAESAEHVRSSR